MSAPSNVGRWDRWYQGLEDDVPQPYGDTPTYEIGGEFLRDCATVEDWGCGKGWFRRHVPAARYRGIDGSHSPFADEIVDLVTYRSQVEGVFMRHVLEHNYGWAAILENALASFTRRFVLVLFTPMGPETKEIAFAADPGVPDISFRREDLTERFAGLVWTARSMPTATQYGVETVFLVQRP